MSIPLHITHNFSLLLEGWTLTLALFVIAGNIMLLVVAFKGHRKFASVLALTLTLASCVLVVNARLANPSTWQVIHAAYVATPPESTAEYASDIRRHWSHAARGILMRDWYYMASTWNVCHELWKQSDCAKAPLEREAMGIARKLLDDVAHGR